MKGSAAEVMTPLSITAEYKLNVWNDLLYINSRLGLANDQNSHASKKYLIKRSSR
jgi:hypothetical protein